VISRRMPADSEGDQALLEPAAEAEAA
jgi:hypothetical protein